MTRLEFFTSGGQLGTCGNPPGQVPKTATPEGLAQTATPGLTQTTTPGTPTGVSTDTPEPESATSGPATQTAVILPTETLIPSLGNLTPQEFANQGTFLYEAICKYSDGDSDTIQFTISFQFADNGVSLIDPEFDDTMFFTKKAPNIYENTEEDLFSRITFTDSGFDYFGDGYSLTGDCVVNRK